MLQYLDDRGDPLPGAEIPAIPDGTLLRAYRAMAFVRMLDARMLNLQRQGRVGFYGTAQGEEAAVIGSAAALDDRDWIFPALRQGGALLYRGFPLERYLAQCFGNEADLLRGRQMPCHYSDRSVNAVSWSSCIGTQVPHAVGMAMAAKLRGDRAIAIAYFGDGATSEGDLHVAMNFAGVFRAPVVFFCQNNQWAITISVKKQTACETIAEKARAYGFEGVRCDGNDALAVHAATKAAADKARAGGGPTLVEALTYRMGAHSTSDDPRRYRDDAEVAAWAARDPVARMRRYLTGRGLWNDAAEKSFEEERREEVSRALAAVEALPPPPRETLFADVYAGMPWHLREQQRELEGR